MKNLLLAISVSSLLLAAVNVNANELKSHHQAAELACEDCHSDSTMAIPTNESCLSCHGPLDELREAVKQPESKYYLDTNPHYSFHYGYGLECSACHSEHQESKLFCNNCHQFEYPQFK